MRRNRSRSRLSIVGASLGILIAMAFPFTQVLGHGSGQQLPILITQPVDDSQLVTLRGNTRPEANSKNDRGLVPDDFPMPHMLLQLKRAPQLEKDFAQYIETLTDKSSPNFHHWMLAAEQGEKYGLAQEDIDAITDWLNSNGFTVGYVYPNRMVIDFSGTAGQIREAFHTEIHYLDVHGEQHFANMSDPQIPEALAPAVVGVVSMNNFKPHAMYRTRTDYTEGGGTYALVPADWETIYNLNPLYRQGIYGQGQTIVLIEDSNAYGTDWQTFVNTFGLARYGGTLTTVHPNDASNCTNPGTTSADGEADLDVEMASAIAPGAAVQLASCADSGATFGGLIAIENLVSAGSPPAIMSVSYGECEVTTGAAANAAFNSAYQSAATAGVSVFVSSGDDGIAACSGNGSTTSADGIGVTGWGETIYNVSVGGTDFEDTYNAGEGGLPITTYWNATNTTTYGSAKSYIPEIPWNDSCAGVLLSNFDSGSFITYGATGFCNTTTGTNFRTTGAGSGGPSGCATGSATTTNWVSGSCAGYAKPSWQIGVMGNPADGVRDIPDVSLFAANGLWGHFTIICWSDPAYTADGSAPCTAGNPGAWSGFGGTSVASPAMASMQALVNQKRGARFGNPNPIYYAIANSQFASVGATNCYSINNPSRRGIGTACVFYDITQGDIDVNCRNTTDPRDCYRPAGNQGAASTGAITSLTLVSGGSGYTGTPTCTLAAPANLSTYKEPNGTTLYSGGTQATCTATRTGSSITAVTLGTAGVGYTGNLICTISGGGGSGATCTATVSVTTTSPSYQPAFGATPGWDFATGIGSVNAYNLVFSSAW